MSIQLARKVLDSCQRYGFRQTLLRIFAPNASKIYKLPGVELSTYKYKKSLDEVAIKQAINNFSYQPLISIILPVYNTEVKWLHLAIESLEKQLYSKWELCITDDSSTNSSTLHYLKKLKHPSIKIAFLEKSSGLAQASNHSAHLATGDYLGLMNAHDELTPDALYEMVKRINLDSPGFIYSDEDYIDEKGNRFKPHFKTDYNPDLLLSYNYITHFSLMRKELFHNVNGFDSRYEGAHEHDLFLKITEKTNKISHVAEILYHSRDLPSSQVLNDKASRAGKLALKAAIERRQIEGIVKYGNAPLVYDVIRTVQPTSLVSIIIPFKDEPLLLERCIESILALTSYQNYEIIGVSNNSTNPMTFDVMKELEKADHRVRFFEYNIPFNYSKINNYAVKEFAKGQQVLLLNNDVEVINGDWLTALVSHSVRPDVGAVGGKLYYPNNTIQHAGILIGVGSSDKKIAGHAHKHFVADSPGYFNRLNTTQNFSALTGACLMVKKSLYEELCGLNEENLTVAFNDVDFCLRLREKGLLNVFTPHCRAYHHESISRGLENTKEKIERFSEESNYILERHAKTFALGDPYLNPNLSNQREDFSFATDD